MISEIDSDHSSQRSLGGHLSRALVNIGKLKCELIRMFLAASYQMAIFIQLLTRQ
jgi:hypothetical protein